MVYKATLKRRVGIEVFKTEKTLKPEEPGQVVAVKDSHVQYTRIVTIR